MCVASDVAQVGSARLSLCVKQHTNTLQKEWGRGRMYIPHNPQKCMERRRASYPEHLHNKNNGEGPPGPGSIGKTYSNQLPGRRKRTRRTPSRSRESLPQSFKTGPRAASRAARSQRQLLRHHQGPSRSHVLRRQEQRGRQRGLAPTTRPQVRMSNLFNIFHQEMIKEAEKNRHSRNSSPVRIPWRHIVQDRIPGPNQFGKNNSECQESHLTMSLFADDTTILGRAREMRTGCDAVKETMQSFEEKNNTLKEEILMLGAEQSADIRML